MQTTVAQRLRITYGKSGPTRFIGHLDILRTWERVLHRARLPLTWTKGFNRRPRTQFAAPLSLGHTGGAELLDVWLDAVIAPEEAQERLTGAMPPGLAVQSVAEVAVKQPALPVLVREAAWQIVLTHDPVSADFLRDQIGRFLAQESHLTRKGNKAKAAEYDLRPLVLQLTLAPESDPLTLHLHGLAQEGRTARPDDLLRALGLDPFDCHIHRTALILDDAALV
jgi:radical SAM-linked protein